MKRKITLFIILALILGAVGAWYYIFVWKKEHRRNPATEKGIVISADSLVQQFITNESAAHTLCNNNTIEVTGTVKKVESERNATVIILGTNVPESIVSIRLKEDNATIQMGNTITAKGLFIGYLLGEVQLNEATVIKNDNKASIPIVHAKDSIKTKPVDTVVKVINIPKQYKSNTAQISFFSKGPAENIEATNSQVVGTLDASTGTITFTSLIKGFRFENELMQEHFNSKEYLNSATYPKAVFEGIITNNSTINYFKNDTYNLKIEGTLSLHGYTQKIITTATMSISNGKLSTKNIFDINFADYKIESWDADAKNVQVTINAQFK